jgi:hypothetical protein
MIHEKDKLDEQKENAKLGSDVCRSIFGIV